MINCKCLMCNARFTVEPDCFALGRMWGLPIEIALARLTDKLRERQPSGINVKCPRCSHTCDIVDAYER